MSLRGSGPAVAAVARLLRPGETVTLTVLERAGPRAWSVLLKGRTLLARSDAELSPGSLLQARVARSGGELLLRLLRTDADLAALLREARLPSDGTAQEAARALLRAGLGVTAERLASLRTAARGTDAELGRKLRAAAEALKKLPDLSADDLELLGRVWLADDEPESRGRRRRQDRRRQRKRGDGTPGQMGEERIGEVVRAGLWGGVEPQEATRGVGLLRLYNHTRGEGEESWAVLPCRFVAAGGEEIRGSVRVLRELASGRVKTVVVGLAAAGRPWWWFRLAPAGAGGAAACELFCPSLEAARDAAPEIRELGVQLGKMGVRLADIIGEGERFDGFSLAGREAPRPVDLQG